MESFIKRIETIYMPVANPKASAEWYEEHLKIKAVCPVEPDAAQAQLALASGQFIFLIQSKDRVNANFTEIGGEEQCMLTLEVTDFHDLYKGLQEKGATVTVIEDNRECGGNFYLYDPDGNKIDIWSGWPAAKK